MWKPTGIVLGFAAALMFTFRVAAQEHQVVMADEVTWQPIPREWFVGTIPSNVQIRGEVAIIQGTTAPSGQTWLRD
jgi:hypothetical protein